MRQVTVKLIPKLGLSSLTLTMMILILASCGGSKDKTQLDTRAVPPYALTSMAFESERPIPDVYTCSGQNVSPQLAWSIAPHGTKTFALIMIDPDAKEFTHWILFNLSSNINYLPEAASPRGQLPAGTLEGNNGFGKIGYGGPCPPSGRLHRYQFTLYALGHSLALETGASREQVLEAMQGDVLATWQLTGTYRK